MARIHEYEVVGMEKFTSKKGEDWVTLHLERTEIDERRVNKVLIKADSNIYQIDDFVSVLEYAGKIQLIQ